MKRITIFIIAAFLIIVSGFTLTQCTSADTDLKDEINARSLFQPLPLGEIEPQGWLLKQARLASNGLTYQPDLLESNVWRVAGKLRAGATTAWWSYEQQAYYLDGATRLGHVLDNKKLLEGLQPTYEAIITRQDSTGYYFCEDEHWRKAWLAKDEGTDHERWMETGYEGMHWSMGIFARAVLAHYTATGDQRLMDLLRKHFLNYYHKGRDADQIGKTINGLELYQNLGMVTWESMVEYVRLTGDKEVYELAVEIFANNEDGMVRNYNNGNYTTVCHNVVFNETTKLYAAGYILTGDSTYLSAVENLYSWVEQNHLQPHGIPSSNEFLRGIGGFLGSETCNVAAYSWSNLWLLRASGKAHYADRMEEAFYNAGQRMVAYDYKTHCYTQCPNSIPGVDIIHGNNKMTFKPIHSPICCTRSMTRALPNFIGHLCMRTSNGGLAQVMYAPSLVSTDIDGEPVSYEVKTDYPFNESINISFTKAERVNFPFMLRVPEWCSNPVLTINGQEEAFKVNEHGFIVREQEWKKGDELKLTFPMTCKVITGREKSLADKNGKEPLFLAHGESAHLEGFKEGAPYGWVKRGPLAYAYPVTSADKAGIALVINDGQDNLEANVTKVPDNWTWGDKSPVSIKVNVQNINWIPVDGNPIMPDSFISPDIKEQNEVNFVPYGCSGTGRMTMFPLASKTDN
jgi:DUF1680 family protein